MARTDTLGHFLTDVADAIREKKGTSSLILASSFDTEIESISGGGQSYRLPDEYQEVEYIETSGTQYINSGYYANGNSQFEFKITYKTNAGVPFGAYNGSWQTGYGYYHNNTSSNSEYVHYYSNAQTSQQGSQNTTQEIIINKGNVKVNGITTYTTPYNTFTIDYPTYVLAGNWAGTRAEQPIACKLYYFTIKESNELKREFIPCYRKSDSVIGMYDLENNTFYTNAGTGSFTAGPNHNTPLVNLQDKEVTITTNTTTEITADEGYDGLGTVSVITSVSGGSGDLSDYFNTTIDSNPVYYALPVIKKIPDITITNNVTNLETAFYNYKFGDTKMKIIGGSNVTSVRGMFQGTSNLNLDLSQFTPTALTSVATMFEQSKIQSVSFKNITSSQLRDFGQMFYGCTNLTSLDLGIETTANGGTAVATRILLGEMFRNCTSLTQLDLSGLIINTRIYNTSNMFTGCTNLTKIDLRNLKLDNVYTKTNMFGSSSSDGVPDNCLIIVKDDASKTALTSVFTRLTNIKTVAEYEAE